MPIYWNEANPSATQAITSHDFLNLVQTANRSGDVLHPLSTKLGYISPGPRLIQTAPNHFPGNTDANAVVKPPIFSTNTSSANRAIFARKGYRPRTYDTIYTRNTASGYTNATLYPSNLNGSIYVIVQMWGAGGGSTTGYTSNNDRAGGGSGGCMCFIAHVDPSTGIQVQIGQPGAGGTGSLGGDGSAGGDTVVKVTTGVTNGWTTFRASGGGAGKRASGGAGGAVSHTTSSTGTHFYMLASSAGNSSGTGTGSYGSATTVAYTDKSPEGGSIGAGPIDFGTGNGVVYGYGGEAPSYGGNNGVAGKPGLVLIWY